MSRLFYISATEHTSSDFPERRQQPQRAIGNVLTVGQIVEIASDILSFTNLLVLQSTLTSCQCNKNSLAKNTTQTRKVTGHSFAPSNMA